MKKMLSVILCTILLASLASCSETSEQPDIGTEILTTSAIETSSATTSENPAVYNTTEETYTPVSIKTDNLSQMLHHGSFSMLIPTNWNKKSEDDTKIEYDISNNAVFSAKFYNDSDFKEKNASDSFTNDEYIAYCLEKNSRLNLYKNIDNIVFIHNTNDKGTYYQFIFYDNGVIDLTFRAYNHGCFSKRDINAIMDTLIFDDEVTSEITQIFEGYGDSVTDSFIANGCTKIKGEYTGESVFFVTLYDSEGNFEGMIFSNLGQYSGEKVFKFENNKKYMFEVTAREGNWKITIE